MNYFKLLKAFYDGLELNPLNTSEIALWHALAFTNNKTAWSTRFTVASSVLRQKSGLKEANFFKSRNSLVQKGYIEWKQMGSNRAAEYHLIDLTINVSTYSVDTSRGTSVDTSKDSSVGTSRALTNKNLNLSTTAPDTDLYINAREETFNKIETEFGRPLSPIELETIAIWIDEDHYSFEIIVCALQEAVLNQVWNLKYMNTILINWSKQHITNKQEYAAMKQQRSNQNAPVAAVPSNKDKPKPKIPIYKIADQEEL